MRTETASSRYAGAPTGRAKRLGVLVVSVVVLVVGLGIWWATSQGFIAPLTGIGCSDEGYSDPKPSYDELVSRGKHPYCARQVRGETWF